MVGIKVTYRKSAIGYEKQQKATLAALGLRRLNQTVEHTATPAIRGMIHRVRHLVNVNGVPADSVAGMNHLREAEAEMAPVLVAMETSGNKEGSDKA